MAKMLFVKTLLLCFINAHALTHCLIKCPKTVHSDKKVTCAGKTAQACDTMTSGAHVPSAEKLDEIVRKSQARCVHWDDKSRGWLGMKTCIHNRTVIDRARYIALVIPYRNRQVHLDAFVSHIRDYVVEHFEDHHFRVLIVNQDDNEPFNRAWLANVGFAEAMKIREWDCVVLHDVDLVPQPGVPYTRCDWPVQLGSELEHFNWGVPYGASAGGVVSMSPKHWRQINGYSNEYKGWGGEDDDLYHRLKLNGLLARTGVMHRPDKGLGRFNVIDQSKEVHTRSDGGT